MERGQASLHLAHRSQSTELSGGERQRVLIARSLAQGASHLLLDEPTNHLDVRYQHEILSLVHALDLTTIVVLHDLNLAARYCDEVVLLNRGRVVTQGAPDAVLDARNSESPSMRSRCVGWNSMASCSWSFVRGERQVRRSQHSESCSSAYRLTGCRSSVRRLAGSPLRGSLK